MNMLSSVTPWDAVAKGYSEITMKVFQGYTDEALSLAGINAQSHVLDICCGPGTLALTAAQTAAQVSAIDFSQAMIDILQHNVRAGAINNIDIHCGDAQHLPYQDDCFDAAFSMFGLMFFPDRMQGYKEILRTLKPGGSVVISSWAPVADSPAMLAVFGALRAMNPDIPEPQADIESLENPEFFAHELADAGFAQVRIVPVNISMQVENIETFWNDMVKGSAPIVMMKNSLPPEVWEERNRIALDYLHQLIPSVPAELGALAWLGVGEKAAS